MTDWKKLYSDLPVEELDKIALLRVMECTNGIIQYAFRDGEDYALPLEETRRSMKFSMGCIKRMEIPLKEETIVFAPETQELMRQARDFYVRGMKQGDDKAYAEFMKISAASAQACGKGRILKAKEVLSKNVDAIPAQSYDWGVSYLMQFL